MCLKASNEVQSCYLQHSGANSKEVAEVCFENYFTFSFVRNPWERVSSWFRLQQKFDLRGRQDSFSLEECLDFIIQEKKSKKYDSFIFNQLDYLKNSQGELVTDFIGRYETFERDIQMVFKKLNFPLHETLHLNETESTDWRQCYDENTKARVAELCQEDIEYFGYTFNTSEKT